MNNENAAGEPVGNSRFDGKACSDNLVERCGVYRMLAADRTVIYVGKARNLRKRVGSYFRASSIHGAKVRAMVAQIAGIEVTVTRTENEALILENNLIKELRPRYNIVLRDDKSYPYIYLSSDQEFPRLSFHRGARKGKGRYFGPYPSAGSVRASLSLLQKLFLLRSCSDSFFRNRTRPCLQYQIKRCSAPCVGLIDPSNYAQDVGHAAMFLDGRSQEIIEILACRMESAATDLAFEAAARYRDQIDKLRRVQQRQYISAGSADIDIVACATEQDLGCVQVFFVRKGHHIGNKAYFPAQTAGAEPGDILSAFVSQYYLSGGPDNQGPAQIIVSHPIDEADLLEAAISSIRGRSFSIQHRPRGERLRWLDMARENAAVALRQKLTERGSHAQRHDALHKALGLDVSPDRIECFDISHTQGEATVASCVVFGKEGPVKSDYRRFNIDGVQAGDDYAAMHQALERRYRRLQREHARLPDLLLIDGGRGQVKQAVDVLQSLDISGIPVVGVAKGPARKAGLETLILAWRDREISLPPASPALHLMQQIRDEAHRFAITGHRQRRAKARGRSNLEHIEGVGIKRRQQLIRYFGGLQGIQRAGVEELAQVPGISRQLAEKIYHYFREGA